MDEGLFEHIDRFRELNDSIWGTPDKWVVCFTCPRDDEGFPVMHAAHAHGYGTPHG